MISPSVSSRVGQLFSSLTSAAAASITNLSPRGKLAAPSKPSPLPKPLPASCTISEGAASVGAKKSTKPRPPPKKKNYATISASDPPMPPLPQICCDWTTEQCVMGDLPPIKCQRSGCSKYAHHVCSIEWASSKKLPEGGIETLCREHQPQYCHRFRQPSPAAKASSTPTTAGVANGPAMKRRQMNAAEKTRMDAILNNIGPPPDWFEDILNDDGAVDANDELRSPDGIEMHRPMPGMSVGVPDASKRATTDATTTARGGKKKSIACCKGVRVVVKWKM